MLHHTVCKVRGACGRQHHVWESRGENNSKDLYLLSPSLTPLHKVSRASVLNHAFILTLTSQDIVYMHIISGYRCFAPMQPSAAPLQLWGLRSLVVEEQNPAPLTRRCSWLNPFCIRSPHPLPSHPLPSTTLHLLPLHSIALLPPFPLLV